MIPRLLEAIDIDIFNPAPIYAISRYSSQASIILLIVNYALVYSSISQVLFTPLGFIYQAIIIGVSLLYFFAPLAGIN